MSTNQPSFTDIRYWHKRFDKIKYILINSQIYTFLMVREQMMMIFI